ncbi:MULTISPECIES: carbohydrate ABC transporter permease [unclassified Crossiella]|uniref:carbohydrate ABC transporter permease n=1 Tax=unclassified Crossiella TaxID=2620835 RepID=UPI0020001136|nr:MULTISPECIES: sugar ABC transporter permease [unclassified Crossiella]MCK2239662.1 sugar ABC transporter permease [Crossiella sp. S99.2]MCK2252357.1 sugar ABC transporter permease [Crossiella sp. S99.1]
MSRAVRGREWSGFWFVAPFLVLYLAFLVAPLLLGVKMSFTNQSITGAGSDAWVGLDNYAELFGDPAVWRSLWNTLVFTALSTPPLVAIGLGLALLTHRKLPAAWLFRLAFFAPYVLPVSVVVLIWMWLYQPGFGLINDTLSWLGLGEVGWLSDNDVLMVSVVLTTVWWTVGFNYLLYLAGLGEIPRELYEAGALDGTTGWSRLRWLTLPLLRRTHVLVLVLQILASLKVFDQVYLLTGGTNPEVRSIVQYIYESGFTNFRVGYASAISYLFFALIVALAVLQFRILRARGERTS